MQRHKKLLCSSKKTTTFSGAAKRAEKSTIKSILTE